MKPSKNIVSSSEELARRLGVSTSAVNKWENGKSMPDITLLARLLGIHIDILLSCEEELGLSENC